MANALQAAYLGSELLVKEDILCPEIPVQQRMRCLMEVPESADDVPDDGEQRGEVPNADLVMLQELSQGAERH